MTPERTCYDILRNKGLEDIRIAGRVSRTVGVSRYREGALPSVGDVNRGCLRVTAA